MTRVAARSEYKVLAEMLKSCAVHVQMIDRSIDVLSSFFSKISLEIYCVIQTLLTMLAYVYHVSNKTKNIAKDKEHLTLCSAVCVCVGGGEGMQHPYAFNFAWDHF